MSDINIITKAFPEQIDTLSLVDNKSELSLYHNKNLKRETLRDITENIIKNYEKLRNFFNAPIISIPIFIFPDQKSFHLFVRGQECPEWLVGMGGRGGIKVIDPNVAEHCGRTYQDIMQVIIHEMVHVFTNLYGWKIRPLSEGIALYFAEQCRSENVKNLVTKNNINPGKIFNAKDENEFADLGGYTYSYTVIEFFIKTFGEAKLKEYFVSEEFAPFKLLGVEPDNFISSWEDWLLQTYGGKICTSVT